MVTAGSTLVAYSTAEENAEVATALPVTEETWIGLRFDNSSGWEWLRGESELYTNWAVGFPDTNTVAAQLPDGTWVSVSDTPRPFLCEFGESAWKVRSEDGHAYRSFNLEVSWDVAAAQCESLGAYLVVISSPQEAVFLRDNFGVKGWIGLSDTANEGVFEWLNGEPVDFEDWEEGEPNGGTLEKLRLAVRPVVRHRLCRFSRTLL